MDEKLAERIRRTLGRTKFYQSYRDRRAYPHYDWIDKNPAVQKLLDAMPSPGSKGLVFMDDYEKAPYPPKLITPEDLASLENGMQDLSKKDQEKILKGYLDEHENGKGNAKRTASQREVDLVVEAQLWLGGKSQQEIADTISINRPYDLSRQTISNDLKEIKSRWEQLYLTDYNEHLMKELARIDRLEETYWDSWERSLLPKEEKYTENIQDKSSGKTGVTVPAYSRLKATRKEITSTGDTRYLDGIQWCVEQRCKILGLYKPKTVNVNWRKEAQQAGIDPDKAVDELTEQFVRAALAGPGS